MTITDEMLKKINASTIRKHFSEVNRQLRQEFFVKAYTMKSAELKKLFKELFRTHTDLKTGKVVAYIPRNNFIKEYLPKAKKFDGQMVKIPGEFDIEGFKKKFPKEKVKKAKATKATKTSKTKASKTKAPSNVKLVIKDKPKKKKKKLTQKEIDKALKKFKDADDKTKDNKKKQNKTNNMFKKKNEKKSPQKLKIDRLNNFEEMLNKVLTTKKEKEELGGFITNILNPKEKEPVLFSNFGKYSQMLLVAIFDMAKNDCGFITNDKTYFQDSKMRHHKVATIPDDMIEKLIKSIIRCKKQKKIVAVPLSIHNQKGSGGHRNMLIFNYHRNEIERYEPWGTKTPKYAKNLDKDLEKFTINFNRVVNSNENYKKELDVPPNWKYMSLPKVCPRISSDDFKGLQSVIFRGEKTTKPKSKSKTESRVSIKRTDPGGWCVMYSLLYTYFRMKSPKLSPKAVQKIIIEKTAQVVKGSANNMVNVLRNFAAIEEKISRTIIRGLIPVGLVPGVSEKVIKIVRMSALKELFQRGTRKLYQDKLINLIGYDVYNKLPNEWGHNFYGDNGIYKKFKEKLDDLMLQTLGGGI